MTSLSLARSFAHLFEQAKELQKSAPAEVSALMEAIAYSWRDSFWGWGPNRDGRNMLGRLWMELRAEIGATP